MTHSWKKLLSLTCALFAFGCVTPPKIATDVKLVVLSSDLKPGKAQGIVSSKDCGFRYVGIGKYPSFKSAFKKSTMRYFKKLSLNNVITYGFGEMDCKYVYGNGFK